MSKPNVKIESLLNLDSPTFAQLFESLGGYTTLNWVKPMKFVFSHLGIQISLRPQNLIQLFS